MLDQPWVNRGKKWLGPCDSNIPGYRAEALNLEILKSESVKPPHSSARFVFQEGQARAEMESDCLSSCSKLARWFPGILHASRATAAVLRC